jgi:hypothetical protein
MVRNALLGVSVVSAVFIGMWAGPNVAARSDLARNSGAADIDCNVHSIAAESCFAAGNDIRCSMNVYGYYSCTPWMQYKSHAGIDCDPNVNAYCTKPWRSQISIATGRRSFLEENFSGSAKAEARAGAVVE